MTIQIHPDGDAAGIFFGWTTTISWHQSHPWKWPWNGDLEMLGEKPTNPLNPLNLNSMDDEDPVDSGWFYHVLPFFETHRVHSMIGWWLLVVVILPRDSR